MVPIDLHLPDTVTDTANQPIMALEMDRHSFTGEMSRHEFDWLTDCHRATGASQNPAPAQRESNIMAVYECVHADASEWVRMCLRGQVVSFIQITHHTLSVVTGIESDCQLGPALIFKDGRNWITSQTETLTESCQARIIYSPHPYITSKVLLPFAYIFIQSPSKPVLLLLMSLSLTFSTALSHISPLHHVVQCGIQQCHYSNTACQCR